jgi:hypothetical protein
VRKSDLTPIRQDTLIHFADIAISPRKMPNFSVPIDGPGHAFSQPKLIFHM